MSNDNEAEMRFALGLPPREDARILPETPGEAHKAWQKLQEECVEPCKECGLARDEDGFLAGVKWAQERAKK
jgi:hypothetical protein